MPVSIPVFVTPIVTKPRAVTAATKGALRTDEIADRFGVKPNTVVQWVKRGRMTPLAERDASGGYLFAPDATPTLAVATG